jgi:hypothetical protein
MDNSGASDCIRKIRHHLPIPCALALKQGGPVYFQHVRLDNFGRPANRFVQNRDENGVNFDRDDASGGGDQIVRHGACSGADLKRRIVFGYLGGGDDLAGDVGVNKEGLPQRPAGPESVFAEKMAALRGGERGSIIPRS